MTEVSETKKDRAEGRNRPTISGIITSFNEEHNIAACIESLLWCDEILVIDSYSTDRTPEIAQSYDKVRFFQRTYFGGAAQKNWAFQHVQCEWIFLLDADERCLPENRSEIETLLTAGPKHLAYIFDRRVFFLGKRIRFSGWQHDRVARLFKRDTAYYQERRVHSLLVTTGPAPRMKHAFDHYMVDRSLYDYALRLAKYGFWGAGQCWREGRRTNLFDLTARTAWRFIRTYVVQLGFLDGMQGLVFCLLQAWGTYMKWATLWGWQVNTARGIEPDLPSFDDAKETWQGLAQIQSRPGAKRG